MSIRDFITSVQSKAGYKNQIVFQKGFSSQNPVYGKLDFQLEDPIHKWLIQKKIQLYSHQAEALNAINKGQNVIVTTPTASGKTLIFSLAVANAIARKRSTTALFLYPTKALANDQLKKMEELNDVLSGKIRPFIYDGDTPASIRPRIRDLAKVIISNPYAIHQYLDWHDRWIRFYRSLRFVVIDESHTYRGIFGSNVAQLIRRLQRILDFYGSYPQFILSSATINNPDEFASKLIGQSITTIDCDGGQYGEKHFLLWNPPFIDKFQSRRRSPHQETRELFVNLIRETNFQALCFTLSRKMTELISLWSKQDLQSNGFKPEDIMAYRAGYRPSERREIEKKLRNGEIQGIVCTNALEVGIDIGQLDAVILSGFPGTIISLKQQIGRAGRSLQPSLACLILFPDAYQQFLGKHPDYLIKKSPENAIIDLNNQYIIKGHLLCATAELPLKLETIDRIWGQTGKKVAKDLLDEGLVKVSPAGLTSQSRKRPASIVGLNSGFTETIEVIANGKLLETLNIPQAYREAHEGAILIHQGELFLVESIDWKQKKARAVSVQVDYYTEVLSFSEVVVMNIQSSKNIGFDVFWGDVRVTEIYHSYRKMSFDEVLDIQPLDLPPLEFETKAMWIEIPADLVRNILQQNLDYGGGIHGLEHATIALSPLFAMCDRWDIGGTSYPAYIDGSSKVFIYDAFPGGIGISERIFDNIVPLLHNVLLLVRECECELGCPSCVQSPKCGNNNTPLDKKVTRILLEELLRRVSDV